MSRSKREQHHKNPRRLSANHQKFINEYFNCWNQTEAYERVYPRSSHHAARAHAARLMADDTIKEEIKRRFAEKCMAADEVLVRLAEHARGDMGAWLSDDGEIDIAAMKQADATKLLRKVKRVYRTGETQNGSVWQETRLEVELHDAQAALVQIGRHHGLFKDVTENKTEHELGENARDILISKLNQQAARGDADESDSEPER